MKLLGLFIFMAGILGCGLRDLRIPKYRVGDCFHISKENPTYIVVGKRLGEKTKIGLYVYQKLRKPPKIVEPVLREEAYMVMIDQTTERTYCKKPRLLRRGELIR